MLDLFLEAAYENDQRRSMRNEMAENFKKLPIEELAKIASGELKLSCCGDDGSWLDRFKGTPMYDQALALEEENLRLEIADQQQSSQERGVRDQIWSARDAVRLKKRMLELQLRQSEAQAGAPAPGVPPEAAPQGPTGLPPQAPAATSAPVPEAKTAADKLSAKVGLRQGADAAKKALEEAAGKVTKAKVSCGMKTAASAMPAAVGLGSAVGRTLASVPLPLIIGGGLGAASAPEGSAAEGALRGGLGAWGGGALGGLGGGLLGSAGGGALGALLGKGSPEAVMAGLAAGGLLGGAAGGIGGGVKGYRYAMKPLREKGEKGKEKKSSVPDELVASMRMAKEANLLEQAAAFAEKIPGAIRGIGEHVQPIAQEASALGTGMGRAAKAVGHRIAEEAAPVGEAIKSTGTGLLEGLHAGTIPFQAIAEHATTGNIPETVARMVGAAAPHGAVGALGYGLGHAAGSRATREAMTPELQKKLLTGLGVGGAAGLGGGLLLGGHGEGKTSHASAELNALAVADIWGRQMAKDAGVLGTMWQGIRGAGSALSGIGSRAAKAYTGAATKGGQGMLAGIQAAGKAGWRGVQQAVPAAGEWISKNPAAALGLGGAAVAAPLAVGGAAHMMGGGNR